MARMIDGDALKQRISDYRCADCKDKKRGCVLCQWDDMVQMIEDAPTVNNWISVKDRLPELTRQVESDDFLIDYSEDVVVLSERRNHLPQIGRYAREGLRERWEDKDYDPIPDVTHWMPLPEPPKEDNDAEQ